MRAASSGGASRSLSKREVHPLEPGLRDGQRIDLREQVLHAGPAGGLALHDPLAHRRGRGLEADQQMVVRSDRGEELGELLARLDHLRDQHEVVAVLPVGGPYGPQVSGALPGVRIRIGPRHLVHVDRRVGDPVDRERVGQVHQARRLARPGRSGHEDGEHAPSVALRRVTAWTPERACAITVCGSASSSPARRAQSRM
jgi:hypothetical protein